MRMVLAVGRGPSSAPGRSDGLGPLAATLGIGLHRVRLRSGGSGAVQDLGLADLAIADVGQLGSSTQELKRGDWARPRMARRPGREFGGLGFLGVCAKLGGLRRRLFSGIG